MEGEEETALRLFEKHDGLVSQVSDHHHPTIIPDRKTLRQTGRDYACIYVWIYARLLTQALVDELDALSSSRVVDAKTAGWTSQEVHQFCSAVRR